MSYFKKNDSEKVDIIKKVMKDIVVKCRHHKKHQRNCVDCEKK